MYASVFGVYGSAYRYGYVVNGCLEIRLAALAVVAASLRSSRRRALIRLLRLHDDLPQPITLLVGAATLHLRHGFLHMSEPNVYHFCLTARNKTILARARTEIPLASIFMYIIHNLEPPKGLVWCDKCNVRVCERTQLLGFTWVCGLLVG